MGDRVVFLSVAMVGVTLLLAIALASGIRLIAHGLFGDSDGPSAAISSLAGKPQGDAPAPSEVTGDILDCPPGGPGPEDVQARIRRSGGRFEQVGTLLSFDAVTFVLGGAGEDARVELAPKFELLGDLSPGSVVAVQGQSALGRAIATLARPACPGAGMMPCPTGGQTQARLAVTSRGISATGRLELLEPGKLVLLGPGLLIESSIESGARLPRGLKPGDIARVQGHLLDDGALVVADVQVVCLAPVTPTPTPSPVPPPTGPPTLVEDTAPAGPPPPVVPAREERDDRDDDPDGDDGGSNRGPGRGHGRGRR